MHMSNTTTNEGPRLNSSKVANTWWLCTEIHRGILREAAHLQSVDCDNPTKPLTLHKSFLGHLFAEIDTLTKTSTNVYILFLSFLDSQSLSSRGYVSSKFCIFRTMYGYWKKQKLMECRRKKGEWVSVWEKNGWIKEARGLRNYLLLKLQEEFSLTTKHRAEFAHLHRSVRFSIYSPTSQSFHFQKQGE